MSLVLEFLPEAAAELECIAGDYEARNKGLGSRFRAEVETACAAIVRHPFLWRLRPGGYRRVNLPGFPYYVAFNALPPKERAVVTKYVVEHDDSWIPEEFNEGMADAAAGRFVDMETVLSGAPPPPRQAK